jgi:hypothetical protein
MTNWLQGSIESAAEFEQHMADIQAVLRSTRQEIAPLGDLIDRLALNPEFVVSTEEAGAVVEQLARNGLQMSQILEGAAESAILLANATGGDMAQAADVATMAMQMFGIQASEINRIADVSQGVINNSRIELEDWALALGNGGAAAALVGVKFEDFATTIAGTVNLFHSARQAGTGAMNFFQRLVPITEVAAEEMRDLGLFTGLSQEAFADIGEEIKATEDRIAELDPRLVHYDELIEAHTKHLNELKASMVQGQNAFFFSEEEAALERSKGLDVRAGQYKGTEEAARLLAEATKDLSTEEQVESFRRIFGNDALETAIGLAQLGAERFAELRAEITIQNSAIDAARVRTQTLAARWRNLGDIWDAIRRKSGEKFIDMLFNLVNRLTALTNANQDRIIAFFGEFATVVNGLVNKILPFVERILPILLNNLEALAYYILAVVEDGDTMNDWLTHMSPGLRVFIERVVSVVNWVKRFAGEVLNLVGSLRETFRPFVEFMLQNVQLKDVLVAAAGAILLNIVPGILRLVGVALAAVKAVSSLRRAWEEDWGGIRSFFEQTWPKIRGPLLNFINNILMGRWGEAWRDAVSVVQTALRDLQDYLPNFFDPFASLISNLLEGDWAGAWADMVTIARNTFNLIKDLLRELNIPFGNFILNILEGDWGAAWEQVVNVATTAFELLKRTLKGLNNPFTDFIVKVLEGDWEGVWEDIAKAARIAFNTIVRILYEFETPLTDFIANVLTGAWDEAWKYIQEQALIAYNRIVAGLYAIDMPITNFLGNVLTGKWDLVWRDVKNGAKLAYDFVVKQLYAIDNPITDFLANILTGKWDLVWSDIKRGATIAYRFIVDGLYGLNMPFTTFLGNVLTGKWKLVWRSIVGLATTAYGLIVDGLYGLDMPFTTFLANVLTGEWKKAWIQVQNFASGAYNFITTGLRNLDTPFTNFLYNILVGNWMSAWRQIQTVVSTVFNFVKQTMLDINMPWSIFVYNVLSGNWNAAWTQMQNFAVGVLEGLKDILPGWLDNFVTLLQQFVLGDWESAWYTAGGIIHDFLYNIVIDEIIPFFFGFKSETETFIGRHWRELWDGARQFVIDALAKIKEYTPEWFNPFLTSVQQLMEGKWTEAWESARQGVVNTLEKIKEFTPQWLDPFITSVQNLLKGEWMAAWDSARDGVVGALELLKNLTPDWFDPFITSVQNLLNGDWVAAWDSAKTGAKDSLEKLKELTPDWFDPFLSSLQLLIDGKWVDAWNVARVAAVNALKKWEQNTADGTWLDTLLDAVLILTGEGETNRWARAWAAVRAQAIKTLKQWELETTDGTWIDTLIDAILLIVEDGDFTGAWEKVRDKAIETLAKWETETEDGTWIDTLLDAVLAIANGEGWKGAWDKVRNQAILQLMKWGEATEEGTWMQALIDTALAILDGNWKGAWDKIRDQAIVQLMKWDTETEEGTWMQALIDAALAIVDGEGWGAAFALIRQKAVDMLKLWGSETTLGSWQAALIDVALALLGEEGGWKKAWISIRNLANLTLSQWADETDPNSFLGRLLAVVSGFINGDKKAWTDLWKLFGEAALDAMIAVFSGFYGALLERLGIDKEKAFGSVAGFFTEFGGAMLNAFTTGFMTSWNLFWQSNSLSAPPVQTPNVPAPAAPPGQDVIPTIPAAASGAEYFKGGLTWVGEKGPEIVSLPTGSKILSNEKSNLFLRDFTAKLHHAFATVAPEARIAILRSIFGNDKLERAIALAGTAATSMRAQQLGSNLGSGMVTNNYNTVNSPVQIGPIYVSEKMGMAQLEYTIENVVRRMRD